MINVLLLSSSESAKRQIPISIAWLSFNGEYNVLLFSMRSLITFCSKRKSSTSFMVSSSFCRFFLMDQHSQEPYADNLPTKSYNLRLTETDDEGYTQDPIFFCRDANFFCKFFMDIKIG